MHTFALTLPFRVVHSLPGVRAVAMETDNTLEGEGDLSKEILSKRGDKCVCLWVWGQCRYCTVKAYWDNKIGQIHCKFEKKEHYLVYSLKVKLILKVQLMAWRKHICHCGAITWKKHCLPAHYPLGKKWIECGASTSQRNSTLLTEEAKIESNRKIEVKRAPVLCKNVFSHRCFSLPLRVKRIWHYSF